MPKVGQMVFWTDSKNSGESKGVGKIVSQKGDTYTLKMKTGLDEGTMVECTADELKPVPRNMKSSEITVKSIARDLLTIAREVLPASEVSPEQKSVPKGLETEGTNPLSAKEKVAARLVNLARALIASDEMEERTWVPPSDAMKKKAAMWQTKKFPFKTLEERPKAAEAMRKWLKQHEGSIQYEEIFLDNAIAVEWRPLREVHPESPGED